MVKQAIDNSVTRGPCARLDVMLNFESPQLYASEWDDCTRLHVNRKRVGVCVRDVKQEDYVGNKASMRYEYYCMRCIEWVDCCDSVFSWSFK